MKIVPNLHGELLSSVAEPVEPKLFGDLEPEPKVNLHKHFCSQFGLWRMPGQRKANFYL